LQPDYLSGHAIRQMFARGISAADVRTLANTGKVICDYPNDKPYPSSLLLAFIGGRPLHAVIARDSGNASCMVVTVYEPDPALWSDDFETRKHP
jgi:uncharacterized protein DUF4258